MNKSELEKKVQVVKNELDKLKNKKSGRRKYIPSHLYEKIFELLKNYSQKELGDKLDIRPDSISRAKTKIEKTKQVSKKQKFIEPPKFIKIEQQENKISFVKGKIILEVVTSSGVKVTLFD